MKSGHLKDSFLLAEFFRENSPRQCFCPVCLLHHVSRAKQAQWYEDSPCPAIDRWDLIFTTTQIRLSAYICSEVNNCIPFLLILDWFSACILAASKWCFFFQELIHSTLLLVSASLKICLLSHSSKYWGDRAPYLPFCQFRPTVAEAGKELKEQRHSACTMAKWLAVVGPDEIQGPFQLFS